MEITIYNSSGAIKATIIPSDASVHHKELMVSDYIQLSFNSAESFAVGDYIIVDGAKYILNTISLPQSNNAGYYSYTLQFDAEWARLGNHIFFYNRQGAREKKWSLTNYAEAFLSLIISNIKDAGLGEYSYSIDSSVIGIKFIEFDGASILDALTQIAEEWECDWWIESNIVYLGQCKLGSAVSLNVGEALQSLSQTDSENDRITRLYAWGSTRNLPTNYRKDDANESTLEGIVERRLKLPEGVNYIDIKEGLTSNEIIEGVKVFEDIYPRTSGTISTVTTKQYTDTIENADGSTITETWNAYRFTDSGIKFSRDYQLEGQDLQITFQSGALTGMTFVVEFNPDGASEETLAAQVWEIIRNDDYGIKLPNDSLKPSVGDTYVLSGWDATKIADLGLVSAAEQELLLKATEWLKKYGAGVYNYEGVTNPIWCAGYRMVDNELMFSSANIIDLELGQRVVLSDALIFGGNTYESRIRAYEKNLINQYIASYTIGESKNYSKTADLQSQMDGITRAYDPSIVMNGGAGVRLIGRYDTTAPTDSNAYSALRSKNQFLDKTAVDSAAKHITFQDGATIIGSAAIDFVDAEGISAKTGEISTMITDSIRSNNYSAVSGFSIESGKDSIINVDKLNVRKRATFNELDIKSIKHVGGAMVISPASCTIAKIEEFKAGDGSVAVYKCYFSATDGERTTNNEWMVNDLALCTMYNLTTQHHFWRRVTGVSSSPVDGYHYINLSADDCDSDSEAPQVGDEVVCFGNRANADRQAAIIINSEGTDAPSLLQLDGINSYSISDSNIVTQLSKTNNIIRGQQIEVVTMSGNKSMQDFADEALTNAKGYTDKREEFLQTQITANANSITLKADKTTVDAIDGRVSKAEADIQVNSDGLSSVVSKQEKVGVEFETSRWVGNDGFSYFVFSNGGGYYVVYSKDPQAYYDGCTLLTIDNVSDGDKIHIEGNNMFVHIIGCDGDYQGAESDFSQEYPSEAGNYNVLGFGGDHYSDDGVNIIDWVATSNWAKVYIMLSDDNPSAYQTAKTTLIKSAYTAESRIRQTADEIELKVGNTGINLDKKQITLSAANTVVKGDLSVQRVMTYYPDGAVRSAYNGNGNGTIVYFYPNGNKMREDVFEYDASGNAIGMSTIYYKADGSISWKLTQNGFETTLSDYWTYEEGMAYTSTISEVRKAIAAYKTSGSIDLPTSVFSTFVATSGSLNQSYNGRVVQGRVATSALPKPQTPYTGYYFDPLPMQRVAEQGSSATIMFFRVKYVNNGKVESITDYDVI